MWNPRQLTGWDGAWIEAAADGDDGSATRASRTARNGFSGRVSIAGGSFRLEGFGSILGYGA
jgi:hypothetical protein